MTVTPGRPSSCGRSGPVADERQRSLAEPPEGAREPDDVLPLDQRADAEKGGRGPGRALERPEPLQVDAAVDDLRLRGGLRDRRDEPSAQPLGDRDHRRGALHDPPGGRPDERILGQVRDVLPVGGDDERCPRGESRQQPREAGREEEVRVDDVRPEAPRGPHRPGSELRVAQLAAAAPVEHDPSRSRARAPSARAPGPGRRRRKSGAPPAEGYIWETSEDAHRRII